MSYERCSPREKQLLDELIGWENDFMCSRERIAERMGISVHTLKVLLRSTGHKYGVELGTNQRFILSIRLVYLRAKELGLIGGGQ